MPNNTRKPATEPQQQQPAPALDQNRQKLLKNLTIHRNIVGGAQLLLFGLAAWFVVIPTILALKNSILFKVAGQALFGTQTSSGIFVSVAKAILPTFMAPYAVHALLAVPLLIWGYQLGFNYINRDLLNPQTPLTSDPSVFPENSVTNRQVPISKKRSLEGVSKHSLPKGRVPEGALLPQTAAGQGKAISPMFDTFDRHHNNKRPEEGVAENAKEHEASVKRRRIRRKQ